jgi:hypothetical protein
LFDSIFEGRNDIEEQYEKKEEKRKNDSRQKGVIVFMIKK